MKSIATVKRLKEYKTIEIRELDCLATEDKMKHTIKDVLKQDEKGENSPKKTNAREQRRAFVATKKGLCEYHIQGGAPDGWINQM